jgi:hypothetical protein
MAGDKMPSREELSKIMKTANYGSMFNREVADAEAGCFTAVGDDVTISRSCLKNALGNKRSPGTVGAKMASAWGSKK